MKIKYLLFTFFIPISFFGQNIESLYDIVAKESCECIVNKNFDLKNRDYEKIKLEFGLCIINSYSNHKSKFDESIDLDFKNSKMMSKFGEDVALKMINHCPDKIIEFGNFEGDDEDEILDNITFEGVFLESKKSDFQMVTVKENNGRIHTLIVLTFFEDVNLITDNLIKKNDKVSVEYFEQEFYDPKLNDFRYYKVIQGIKKI
ncbi:hypothetical protein [Flavobacterium orientale]|uniref:Uncharacterized protein n=1 Tax=Flavobacterium orientale TaxID=1756020 RepID=A0A917DFJ7_9FLAO|nr:hypothetical protein [Flavobacterium orientale]GGD36097.1 hypothetical protein GCM10011343_27440 [Flavobacterium orientale]